MGKRWAIGAFILAGVAAAGVAVATPASTEPGLNPMNQTVIVKNSVFPLKVRMTMDPCAAAACVDI
jgi:hypothetical protein